MPFHPLTSSPSTLESTTSLASPEPSLPAIHTDDISDDEEGGVFFGKHHPTESLLAQQLSNASPASSSSISTLNSPQHIPRRPSRSIVRKRDSREFLRRKTLLLPRDTNPSNILREIKDVKGKGRSAVKSSFRDHVDSDGDVSSPPSPQTSNIQLPNDLSPTKSSRDLQSDLTLDFSAFRLADITSPIPSYQGLRRTYQGEDDCEHSEDDASSMDGDSDKENNTVPKVYAREASAEDASGMRDLSPLHRLEDVYTDEEIEDEGQHDLDMGGLRLSDFSDPDTGVEDVKGLDRMETGVAFQNGVEESLSQLLGDSDGSEDGRQCLAGESEGSHQVEIQPEKASNLDLTLAMPDVLAMDLVQGDVTSPSATRAVVEVETDRECQEGLDNVETQSVPTFFADHTATSTSTSVKYRETKCKGFATPPQSPTLIRAVSDTSFDVTDSPLPVVRGGPVIIPKLHFLAHLIPIESTSPISYDLPLYEDDLVVADERLIPPSSITNSPPSERSPETFSVSSPIAPTVATTAVGSNGQGRTIKPLKSSIMRSATSLDQRRPLISSPKKQSKKEVVRALAIREKLDAASLAVSGMKMGSTGNTRAGLMGPPQRSISTSSTVSFTGIMSRPTSKMANTIATSITKTTSSARNKETKAKIPNTLASSTSSVLPHTRPVSSQANPFSRPATLPRNLPQPLARSGTTTTLIKPARPPSALGKPSSMIDLRASFQKPSSPQPFKTNPLKRPFPAVAPLALRQGISLGPPSRPMPMQPCKALPAIEAEGRPIFSLGVSGSDTCSLRSPASRRLGLGLKSALHGGASRGTPGSVRMHTKVGTPLKGAGIIGGAIRCSPAISRAYKMGTPSRGLGTPTKPFVWEAPIPIGVRQSQSFPTHRAQDVETIASASSPPVLRESTQRQTESVNEAASSMDKTSSPTKSSSPIVVDTSEEYPIEPASGPPSQFTRSSPSKTSPKPSKIPKAVTTANRPKRSTKPPPPSSSISKSDITIVPGMSEKELKAMTQRNTSRNEVFFCAIDRQIIKRTGDRPPSPKIRTWEEREEEERKKGRGQRAKKRSKSHEGDDESEEESLGIERLSFGNKAPGDQEEWIEPERPAKRAKVEGRVVKWDKEMTVFKGELGSLGSGRGDRDSQTLKSCMRNRAQVELDRYGNVVEKDKDQEKLKRPKVTINAIYYDGEEPVAFQYNKLGGKSGKGKKK